MYQRIRFAFTQLPKRLYRLFFYYSSPFYKRQSGHSLARSFPLLLADAIFFFDFYEIISGIFKQNTRPLTPAEIEKGKVVFGNKLNYAIIRIDEKARVMTQGGYVIYVGFNTINSWGTLREDIFIHELMHVWQYQKFGAGYIANALKAQVSEAGYNYAYTEGWHEKSSILDFNVEQQADLIQDYYRLKHGVPAQWKIANFIQLAHYQKFIDELLV